MLATARQLGHEPRVDGARGRVSRAVDVPDRPRELGRREVGIQDKPCHLAHALLMAGLAQPRALVRRAAVLPHDGGRDRLERLAVPEHERLALIGDPDRRHAARADAGLLQSLAGARLDRGPDLVGVVLDPAGPRVELGDLAITLAADRAVETDRDRGRACRAFVER